jgi:predicted negative regulator of RcsB-dependent stress response
LARSPETIPHTTLEELESYADRIAHWIGTNPIAVVAMIAAILIAAAGYGGFTAYTGHHEDAGSAALSKVEREFLDAMGASAGSTEIVEPANPETAKAVRREYAQKLLAVADEHSGTAAAAVARITAGDLLAKAGDRAPATEAWRAGMAGLGSGDPLRGIALQRIAAAHEAEGQWAEAGAAYLEAAELPGFPLQRWALADAARSYAEAGELDRATGIAMRLAAGGAGKDLPPHLEQQMAELRARTGGGAAPAATEAPAAATP